MDGPQAIIAIVVLALFLTGTAIAITFASETTADTNQVNETNTTGAGINETVTFNSSNIEGAYYSDTATVLNSTGVTLEGNGTDYTWRESNGTLRVESQAAANESLTANYTVAKRTENQQAGAQVFANLLQAGAWMPFFLFIGLLVVALSLFGGLA